MAIVDLPAAALSVFPFVHIHPAILPSQQAERRRRGAVGCLPVRAWLSSWSQRRYGRIRTHTYCPVSSSYPTREGVEPNDEGQVEEQSQFFSQSAPAEPQMDQGCFFFGKAHKYRRCHWLNSYFNPLQLFQGMRYERCAFGFLLFHPHNPSIPISETTILLLPDLLEQLARALSRGKWVLCGAGMTNPSHHHDSRILKGSNSTSSKH